MEAEWVEWTEVESILSKLQHKLALVPGSNKSCYDLTDGCPIVQRGTGIKKEE